MALGFTAAIFFITSIAGSIAGPLGHDTASTAQGCKVSRFRFYASGSKTSDSSTAVRLRWTSNILALLFSRSSSSNRSRSSSSALRLSASACSSGLRTLAGSFPASTIF
ncbi:hypothetical protein KC330_g123 [Hortaea werneckii]|nr:hypothetical protein KC330_g123 [Hortaea werneckii]